MNGRLLPINALLVLLVFALYQNSFAVPFQFDDYIYIVKNQNIVDLFDFGAIWHNNPARFFTFLTLAFNYHLGGLELFGYHLFNITIHAFNVLAVFWLTRLIFSFSPQVTSPLFLLAPALLFACHPMQTQAVTYIWQRASSLVALFYLLSLCCYLVSARVENEAPANGRRWLFVSVMLAFAAMLLKQNAVTLPLAIVLADYCFVSGSLARLKNRVSKLACYLPALMVIPILTATGSNMEIAHLGKAKVVLSPLEYLLTQTEVIAKYLFMLVVPLGQSVGHDVTPVRSIMMALPNGLFLVLLLALGIWLFRRNRIASFGILFFFLSMSVESSILPLEDLMFEHRIYLPVFGIWLASGSVVAGYTANLSPLSKQAGTAIFAIWIVTLGMLTINRNEVWQSEVSLWTDAAKTSPTKPRNHANLGSAYYSANNLPAARDAYEQAVKLDPDYTLALTNLGSIVYKLSDHKTAMNYLNHALEVEPTYIDAHMSLGAINVLEGDDAKAAYHYLVVSNIDKGSAKKYPEAVYLLADAQARRGNFTAAIKIYERILRNGIDPRVDVSVKQIEHNLATLRQQKLDPVR